MAHFALYVASAAAASAFAGALRKAMVASATATTMIPAIQLVVFRMFLSFEMSTPGESRAALLPSYTQSRRLKPFNSPLRTGQQSRSSFLACRLSGNLNRVHCDGWHSAASVTTITYPRDLVRAGQFPKTCIRVWP